MMNSEKERILELLESGRITAKEAAQLIEALDSPDDAARSKMPANNSSSKKLRVKVKDEASPDSPINVDVAVPIALARVADNIISNCLPTAVHEELVKQGINIKELNLGQILDTLENLDEDIVNVHVDNEGANMKVRVYVE